MHPIDAFAQPIIRLLVLVGLLILAWQFLVGIHQYMKVRQEERIWQDYFKGHSDAPAKEKR